MFLGLYFQIFALITFLEKDEPLPARRRKDWPSVSITVPCYNEENTVTGTIASLLKLDYPKDKLDILVVDDGSTDGTYATVARLAALHPQIKLIRKENGGKYTALNLGIEHCKSELCGGLDADSFVDPQALKHIVACFDDGNVMAVTPAIKVNSAKNILELIQRAEYNFGIFIKYVIGKMNAIHVTPGPFSIFRRSVFDKVGYYRHAHNTEDMEIAFRLQEQGLRIVNCPQASVYTVTPRTLRKLYVQRVRWISGFLKNCLDYKHLFFNPKGGEMGFFTLPFAIAFIVSGLYMFGSFAYYLSQYLWTKVVQISTIGFSFLFHVPHFNWFFFNTESIAILGLLAFSLAITFLLLGKKMSEGSMKPSLDIVYIISFYSLISPFWLTKSIYNTLASRKVPWR